MKRNFKKKSQKQENQRPISDKHKDFLMWDVLNTFIKISTLPSTLGTTTKPIRYVF